MATLRIKNTSPDKFQNEKTFVFLFYEIIIDAKNRGS